MVKWCELTQYTTQRVKSPLQSGRLQDNLSPESFKFINEFKIMELEN